MNKNINNFIDIEKALLMILVIIGHFNFFEYEARTITLIYSFHMPAFFIIAGYLSHITENDTITNILNKRFKTTIIPYYIFYFISFVIMDANSLGNYNLSLKYMFNGIGNPDFAVNLPLWFLTLYFVATTIFEILDLTSIRISKTLSVNHSFFNKKYIKNIILLLFVSLLSFVSFIYCRILKGPRLIYNFETAMLVLVFIYIGKISRYFLNSLKNIIIINYFQNKNKKKIYYLINILLFIIIFIIWYNLSMKNLRLDLNARNIRHIHLTYINGVLGTILLMYITYLFSLMPIIKDILAYLGRISLYILAFHIPGNLITYFVLYDYMPKIIKDNLDSFNIISVLVKTSVEILFSVFMFIICSYVLKIFRKENYK